jgi:hypothetical protein
VHDHQRVEARELLEGRPQLSPRQRWELVHARVHQEALHAEDARLVQAPQVADVAGHRAAPEAHVDVALAVRRRALDLQGGDVDGRRQAVERHVDDRRDAPGRGGTGRRGEALPLGAARLVDVDVGVDEPGQQDLVVGQLEHLRAGERRRQRLDRRDPPVGDAEADAALPRRRDGPRRPDDQVVRAHDSPPADTPTGK